MDIKRAKQLKAGDVVQCPPDNGAPGFVGKVVNVGPNVSKTIYGDEYVWITVKRANGFSGGVWPSNRLS